MVKIAFLHDYFNSYGGGERMALYFSKYRPDYYTYFFNEAKTFKELKEFKIFSARNPIMSQNLRQIFCAKYFEGLKLSGYDLIMMDGFYSIHAAANNHPNIWYSYGPTRVFLPDTSGFPVPIVRKLSVSFFNLLLKKKNQIAGKNVDKIISISEYARERIARFYNRESEVLFAPVETEKFYNKPAEDFYLTVSRLESNKRIDLIVRAFVEMPDKKLIVVGDGSQREYLKSIAKNSKNIQFAGRVDDKTLIDLYSRCTAFIFMAVYEDFGLVPLEAMAAGKPVITVNEGGPKETVIPKKTGFVINPKIEELKSAVKLLTIEKAESMKKDCISRAREFDLKNFYRKMDDVIKESLR